MARSANVFRIGCVGAGVCAGLQCPDELRLLARTPGRRRHGHPAGLAKRRARFANPLRDPTARRFGNSIGRVGDGCPSHRDDHADGAANRNGDLNGGAQRDVAATPNGPAANGDRDLARPADRSPTRRTLAPAGPLKAG